MAKVIPHHRHQDSRKQWTTYSPDDPTLYATMADITNLQAQIDLLKPQTPATSTEIQGLKDDVAWLTSIVCPPKP
jgi:hypothetical protein